ncbi:hypothetical protein bcgnr5379_60610 [Bacillus cereus]|uniref:ATP-binding protein n=1 Tax=Lysobacter enzymogenes TaxID=69 RepID=A0AAU9ADQ9_LYSEN|nr:hypothetical protein LEN_0511 [Lysobacter enzymogenes]
MLKFPVEVLSDSLENLLRDIRRNPTEPLSMPTRLDYGGAYGSAVHALQVIASWSQGAMVQRVLNLPGAYLANQEIQNRFASTLPGMAGLYFSDMVKSADVEVSRYSSLKLVAPYVNAMQERSLGRALRGAAIILCCFAGARNEYLNALYEKPMPKGVREVSDFRVLISQMLGQFGDRVVNSVGQLQLDYLSGLIYQLFLNADEHGSYDISGNRYETAMRGLAVRHTIVDKNGVYGADNPLQAYLTKLLLTEDVSSREQDGKVHLIEISVFDTGPGLGLRWLAAKKGAQSYQDISLKEEEEAVQTCFEKHASTKASQLMGQGLSQALWAMKKLDAFMSLRTGRLSLYQDLTRKETAEFRPVQRYPNQSMPPIAGTGYTIYFRVK